MTNESRKVVGMILLGLGTANFVVFAIVGLLLGGDAWDGKIEQGHYYLSQHGRLTEVSRGVWIYSYVHVLVVFALIPVMILGALMYLNARGLLRIRFGRGKSRGRGDC